MMSDTETTAASTEAGTLAPTTDQTVNPPGAANPTTTQNPTDVFTEADIDANLPPPTPDLEAMLYGLVGDIARAGSSQSEANPVAIGLNTLAYVSAMVGRDIYLPIGDRPHHANLYACHVGRTSEGRKGDALALPRRLHKLIKKAQPDGLLGQVYNGGLSTAEGLILLIHDGFGSGKNREPAIPDKRLLIEEEEFGDTLAKFKRSGNTLSTTLRKGWDGQTLAPAVKNKKIGAKDPHLALAVGVTPRDLKDLMGSGEIANGFANRFIIIWAERTGFIARPQPLADDLLQALADRLTEVIAFAKGAYPDENNGKDTRAMQMTEAAEALYTTLYEGRLNAPEACPVWDQLLQRRAPTLLRLAMLFALTDLTLTIDIPHLNAALAWVSYWEASVRFIFARHDELQQASLTEIRAEKIVQHLQERTGQPVSRSAGPSSATRCSAKNSRRPSWTPPFTLCCLKSLRSSSNWCCRAGMVSKGAGPASSTGWLKAVAASTPPAGSEARRRFQVRNGPAAQRLAAPGTLVARRCCYRVQPHRLQSVLAIHGDSPVRRWVTAPPTPRHPVAALR